MADWRGVQEGLVSGYQVGRSTGGKRAGLGGIIAKVADRLRSQRETGEEQGRKINLLGVEGLMKEKLLEKKGEIKSRLQKEEAALKVPSYTDQFRIDLQDAGTRIQSGEDVKVVTNELIQKYPGSMTADIIYNLKEVGTSARKPIKPVYNPQQAQDWSNVPMGRRILSAITPSATPEEQKLGGLRIGGMFKPPPIGVRKQAMDALKSAGYPITEANIKAAMEQLGK